MTGAATRQHTIIVYYNEIVGVKTLNQLKIRSLIAELV